MPNDTESGDKRPNVQKRSILHPPLQHKLIARPLFFISFFDAFQQRLQHISKLKKLIENACSARTSLRDVIGFTLHLTEILLPQEVVKDV